MYPCKGQMMGHLGNLFLIESRIAPNAAIILCSLFFFPILDRLDAVARSFLEHGFKVY